MVDELRRQDWAPRSLRRTERELSHARRDFRAIHHRQPSDEEVSHAVGITEEKLRTHQQDARAMSSVAPSTSWSATTSAARSSAATSWSPTTAIRRRRRSARSTATRWPTALATLTERERTVVGLLYFHDMTLVEVGQILGVSESRVCQINRKAKARLHEQLAGGVLALAA